MLSDYSGLGEATPEYLDRWTATQAAPKAPQRKRPCRSRALVLDPNRSFVELRVGEPRLGARSAPSAADRVRRGRSIRKAGEILMSSRSERCLANAERCQQYADAVDPFGTKRLYEELSRQWRRLSEQAEETNWLESSPSSAGLMALREPQLTSLTTSAINSNREMFDDLEREIERFKNSAQLPLQETPVSERSTVIVMDMPRGE